MSKSGSNDLYKTLGINKGASQDEVKKAYRRMAHKHHPDKKGGNEQKFKEINAAYQVLSDEKKRAQYDQFGNVFEGAQGGGPWQGWSGFSGSPFSGGQSSGWSSSSGFDAEDLGDIFETIFSAGGGSASGWGGRQRRTYQRGSDIEVIMSISLEEAYHGVKKTIQVETLVACSVCSGSGGDKGRALKACGQCDGKGEFKEVKQTFFGNFSQVRMCPKCLGEGRVPEKACKKCTGSGRLKNKKDISLEIQRGIGDGQLIKVTGEGEAGVRGTKSGDLYVRIRVLSHSRFRRQGDDLYYRTKANLSDILMDKPILIPSIEGGEARLEIPNEFNIKEPLKIRGMGMPLLGGSGRGDLVVELDLVVPKKLSVKAKKLLEELKKEL